MSRWSAYAPALFVVLAALAGCASSPSPVAPPRPLTDIKKPLPVERLWAHDMGSGADDLYLQLPPLLAGDRGFVADYRGRVWAFDVPNGTVLWKTDLERPVSSGAGLVGDTLLFGTREGAVLALDAQTGAPRWRAELSSEVLAPPRGEGDTVVVRTVDGRLYGLDVHTGQRQWVYDRNVPVLTLRGTSAPVVGDGIVVAGFDSGKLAALSLDTGTVLWEATVAVPRGGSELERLTDIDGDPVMRDGVIYVASYGGRVAAVQLASGRLLWNRDIASYAGLAVDDTRVYVTGADGAIWALDRRSGATVWKQGRLLHRRPTAPAVAGDYLVVGDYAGYLHWLSQDDGRLVARHKMQSPLRDFSLAEPRDTSARDILAAPAVEGDRVYVADHRGVVGGYRLGTR